MKIWFYRDSIIASKFIYLLLFLDILYLYSNFKKVTKQNIYSLNAKVVII